jgi:hypothetical protein
MEAEEEAARIFAYVLGEDNELTLAAEAALKEIQKSMRAFYAYALYGCLCSCVFVRVRACSCVFVRVRACSCVFARVMN